MAEPILFLPPFLPSSIDLFILGDFNCHQPSRTEKVLPSSAGRKYSTGSSPPNSSPSRILTHPTFYVTALAVIPHLTSPLLPPLLPFLAPGRCFRIWILTTYQFFYLSLSPRFFAPTSVFLPSTFRKLAGMTLPFTLTYIILLQRNTRLILFPLLLNAAKSSIPFSRIKRPPKAWWSA